MHIAAALYSPERCQKFHTFPADFYTKCAIMNAFFQM